MTAPAARAFARALLVGLLLAAASSHASAGELYRWVTEDGRVEIGPVPPAGASAVPWRPGQDAAAKPAEATAPAGRAKGRARGDRACARHREASRQTAQALIDAETEVTRLEQKIEMLESSHVAYSRTSCVSQGIDGPRSNCVSHRFDRDAEIERAEAALDAAQERLADLELHARREAPSSCPPASAD